MKKSVGVLLATAVLALSSACGQSGSDAGAASGDAGRADTTAAADESPSDAPLTRDNFAERLSAAQLDAGSAHIETTTSASGMDVSMTGDVVIAKNLEDSASRVSMDSSGMAMEVRVVGGNLYMKMGQMTGDKFVEIDLDDPDGAFGKSFGNLTEQVDPGEQLALFDEALVEFENQGSGGEIDGVETSKLRLVLDTEKVLGANADAKKLGSKLPQQMEYVLFVGQDDLMRRMVADIAGTSTTTDWSRWGEDVEVEAPKKSEITDAPAFPFPTAGALDG